MGYAAILGSIPVEAWCLLLANIFWAVAYDTEYAMVDRNDDLKIGIRTAAITFGQHDVLAVMACYFVMIAILVAIGELRGLGLAYDLGLAGATGPMGYYHRLIRQSGPDQCLKAINNNNWVGSAILSGFLAD